MKKEEFFMIREELNLTQKQLSDLLVTSLRAIQSYEQGWRVIPPCVERNLLLLLMKHRHGTKIPRIVSCYSIKNCPEEQRNKCFAYREYPHNLCWYLTGSCTEGNHPLPWQQKIQKCRNCEVFQILFEKQ